MQPIQIKQEIRDTLLEELQEFFRQERGEDISKFQAGILLDFIIANIGPYIYNQAINDAYEFMNKKTEDLLGLEKRRR